MIAYAKDKALWEKIRTSPEYQRHRDDVMARYEWACSRPTPVLTYWQVSGEEGKGVGDLLYHREMKLYTSAILSLIYPDDETYFRRLVDTIWEYCCEVNWVVGDYSEYYGVSRDQYFKYIIEIGTASLGMTLAEIKYLFSDRLPKYLIDLISDKLRRHIIEPYLNHRFFWEWHDNNWASVCAGGVGAVLMYEDPRLFCAEKGRIAATMKCYLDSFDDDGVCVEGSAYWGFGFGFFVNYAVLLREFTKGQEDWFKNPKVKSIAQFMQKAILDDHTLVTFSDVNPSEGYWIGMPHILRDIYGEDIEKLPPELGTITVYRHFSFMLRSFACYKPEYNATELNRNVTNVMPDKGWITKRTPRYSFAAKGGHNGESHNHIDVGNFIFVHKDQQILCDMGAGDYRPGYHGKERYTYFAPCADAHNLPIFDGAYQSHIMQETVVIDYDGEKDRAHCEFARAYQNPKLKRLDRTFDFLEDGVLLTDSYDYEGETVVEHFVTAIPPVIEEGRVRLNDTVLIAEDGLVPTIRVRQHDNHGIYHKSPYTDVYCLDYTLPKGKRSFTLRMEVL